MRPLVLSLCVAAACGSPASSPPGGALRSDGAVPPDAAAPGDDQAAGGDLDGDGLDDAYEARLARDYLPYINLEPDDGCATSGLLFRARPHPDDPARVLIFYDHLYQRDCGASGHVGDNEGFGVSIDPARPPPEGILAIVAISHQNTLCQVVSDCGRCTSNTCDTAMQGGRPYPVVWPSKDKHGHYARRSKCSGSFCFDSCTVGAAAALVPMQNAGEPGRPLTTDLTTQGFITAANGWTEAELMHFDPWAAGKTFGSAGVVADDLVDRAFIAPSCP